ncbi:hypothetical protein FRC03_003765 [Tulasnella sp. 419]|nr:hypothetical protein FRC03_003765 [Tulasnella sp. 419]
MNFTQTKEYEKAYKHYLKTRQNTSDASLTPFRAQEKKYKSKFPPPTLVDVVDPWAYDEALRAVSRLDGIWSNDDQPHTHDMIRKICLKNSDGSQADKHALLIPSCPGLVIVPAFLSADEQRSLIRSSLQAQARSPNETNLDTHYHVPEAGIWNMWTETIRRRTPDSEEPIILPRSSPCGSGFRAETPSRRTMINNEAGSAQSLSYSEPLPNPTPSSTVPPLTLSQAILKLRWANIGRSYHWGTKSYDFSRTLAPFPQDVRDICKNVVINIPWNQVWDENNSSVQISEEEWGEEGRGYADWGEEYEPDAGIVNFYQWNKYFGLPATSMSYLRSCVITGHLDGTR